MFLILLGLFFYVFATNTITGLHKIYLFLHSVFMIWPLLQFISQTMPDPQYRLLYLSGAYSGISLLGMGWFVFIVILTGQTMVIRTRRLILLSIPALLSSVMALVNPRGMFLSINEQLGVEKQLQSGPFFWFMSVQLIIYLILSFFILAYTLRKKVSARHQMLVKTAMNGMFVLLFFGIGDLLINIVFTNYMTFYIPLISIGMVFSAIYLVHAITRNRVFDIIQIVQRDIMNTMSTGIIVLDETDTVIEVNKAIKSILKFRIGDKFTAQLIASQLPKHTIKELEELFEMQRSRPLERLEAEIALYVDNFRYVVVQSAPIFNNNKKKAPIGRLLTFHDVTELRMLVEETNTQNELLQERNHELMLMQDELFQANKKLEHMSITDSLTGCYNRRYLLQQLEHEIAVNMRYGIPFSIFLFDIDLFKTINDTYGHLTGDEVLCRTVDAVRSTLRLTDVLARYGGEEFTVYLPHTNREQANIIAEMVKESVEQNLVKIGNDDQTVSVTISMGVVSIEEFNPRVLDDPKAFLKELLAQTDAALYEAKYNGRNRIVKRKLA